MPQFPRYMTFTQEERERLGPVVSTATGRGSRLLKEHRFSVTFPDTTTGTCSYERLGPACHRFQYRYYDGVVMPQQYSLRPLENTAAAIEAKGREMAEACFAEAIRRERTDYFMRASEPSDGSRRKRPHQYQMRAGRAKELAGKYALCREVGERLIPVSQMYERLEEANQAWKDSEVKEVYVACCNRLDRCWEVPRYNPISAIGHPVRPVEKKSQKEEEVTAAAHVP